MLYPDKQEGQEIIGLGKRGKVGKIVKRKRGPRLLVPQRFLQYEGSNGVLHSSLKKRVWGKKKAKKALAFGVRSERGERGERPHGKWGGNKWHKEK